MRILLAEDEADLNQIITRKLTSDGYSVDSCYNGSEAIDFLEMADYDAVILDIMMPKTDGFGVLRHIRNTGKSVPVLFLTAKDSVADRVKGLDSGADDYLIKPFSLEELTARIRAMTRKNLLFTFHLEKTTPKVSVAFSAKNGSSVILLIPSPNSDSASGASPCGHRYHSFSKAYRNCPAPPLCLPKGRQSYPPPQRYAYGGQ